MSSDLRLLHLSSWLLSSPPIDYALHVLRNLLIDALSKGPVPRHIAFIMDGNRRYARSHKLETIEGHNRGFEALARVLDICYKCGVKVVTVYAFSTENFNRPRYEVDGLMQLAKAKLAQLSAHGDLLDMYGASVRILGERERIPADVLEVCDRATEMTKNNNDAILNICFPYTSREEITAAIRETVREYSEPVPLPSTQFDPARISRNIRSSKSSIEIPPDLVAPPSTAQAHGQSHRHGQGHGQAACQAQEAASHINATQASGKDDEFTPGSQSLSPTSPPSSLSRTPSLSRFDADDTTSTVSTCVPDSTPGTCPESNKPVWPPPSLLQPSMTTTQQARRDNRRPVRPVSRQDSGEEHMPSNFRSNSQSNDSANGSTTDSANVNVSLVQNPESITAQTIDRHMYTNGCPPLDILVRTSGVTRLSDFLLWQVHSDTHIAFMDCYWPEFGLRQFLPVLLEWQWRQRRKEMMMVVDDGRLRAKGKSHLD